MKKAAYLAVFAILAFVATSDTAWSQEELTGTKLEVVVNVDSKATPDLANISAGVVTSASTAGLAMQENASKMKAVFEALKKEGVPERDIQTAGLSVQPQYHYQNNESPKIVGYQAINNVNVTLRDMDKIGGTLDVLIAQGANQISGPFFDVDDRESVLDKVRTEAIAKAKRRAELYSDAAGLKIKRIVSISENVGQYSPMPYQAMNLRSSEAAQAETPVALGQVNLGMAVTVVFELE